MNIILIRQRNKIISPDFVNKTVGVHDGKNYIIFLVMPKMLGKKFGSFSFTRKSPLRKLEKRRKKRKNG